MSYNKAIVHPFSINTRISQPLKVIITSANLRLTNPDVNLKGMHQLYNDISLLFILVIECLLS